MLQLLLLVMPVDFGNLSVSRHALASAADSTRGLFAGGAAGGECNRLCDY